MLAMKASAADFNTPGARTTPGYADRGSRRFRQAFSARLAYAHGRAGQPTPKIDAIGRRKYQAGMAKTLNLNPQGDKFRRG